MSELRIGGPHPFGCTCNTCSSATRAREEWSRKLIDQMKRAEDRRKALEGVQWPDLPFDLEETATLIMRRGSESHGLYIPPEDDMGTDDRDLMAVVIPPPEYVFGLKTWSGTAESIKGVWDVVVYDWRKFIGLLVKQNPNAIGMLYLEEEDYLLETEPGRQLIEMRTAFSARKPAYTAFVGYAHAQLQKMTNGAKNGYMGAKRQKLVERFGYDVKNATHLIRLLRMGGEYLRTGAMRVRRTADAEELKSIKQGKWKLAEVQALAQREFEAIDKAMDTSILPEAVDEERINALCYEVAREAYFR